MSPSFLSQITWLDALGIALAIIGFFNLAQPLERAFRYVRVSGRAARHDALKRRRKHWPPSAHKWFYIKEAFWAALHIILTLYLAHWMFGTDYAWFRWIMALPAWVQMVGILLVTPLLMSITVFFEFIWSGMLIVQGTILWRGFQLLAKAPAGVVGSIGLVVTLASVVIG